MNKKYKYISIIIFSVLFSALQPDDLLSNELYITGEDGVIRMYVNVIGHVKKPGTYLVYDNIDIMSMLSISGGYMSGSDLKEVIIYSENGNIQKINLKNLLASNSSIDELVKLNPHDTIYIKQTKLSQFFVSSSLPSMILSFINLIITLENAQN